MLTILNIAGQFVVYRPASTHRPVYEPFATIWGAVTFRKVMDAFDA